MRACRLVLMLRKALDVKGQGSNMYLSYGLDLTNSCQRQASKRAQQANMTSCQAVWAMMDDAHAWNAHIAKPLIGERAAPRMHVC